MLKQLQVCCGLLLAASTTALADQVYYDSHGFEQPHFSLGTFAGESYWTGQDMWVAIALPGTQTLYTPFQVQSNITSSGLSAVQFSAAGQPAGTNRTEMYRGNFSLVDLRYMVLSVDFYISDSSQASGEWILAQQQTAMTGLSQFGILPDGHMRAVDRITNEMLVSNQTVSRNQWHTLICSSDYETGRQTYWVDGAEVFRDIGTVPPLGFYGLFGIFNIQPGNDSFFMDNLRIVNSSDSGEPQQCDAIDFNNDTSLFDPQDIEAFLSVYSEGPCIPSDATCNDVDFNNDSSVFDPCDISSFLVMYAEGPCTPCGQ